LWLDRHLSLLLNKLLHFSKINLYPLQEAVHNLLVLLLNKGLAGFFIYPAFQRGGAFTSSESLAGILHHISHGNDIFRIISLEDPECMWIALTVLGP
jgi:hypothetical protein